MKKHLIKIICCCLLIACNIFLLGCSSTASRIDSIYSNADHATFATSVKNSNDGTYSHKATGFNGIYTIYNLDTSKNDKINVELTILSGDFGIVFIDDDGEHLLFDNDFEGEIDLSNFKSGVLKIKGENASFNLFVKKANDY